MPPVLLISRQTALGLTRLVSNALSMNFSTLRKFKLLGPSGRIVPCNRTTRTTLVVRPGIKLRILFMFRDLIHNKGEGNTYLL